MKLINIFLLCFGLITIISCKTSSSDVSDTALYDYNGNIILLGTAKDETSEVVCMFTCGKGFIQDKNVNKSTYCKDPFYMKSKVFNKAVENNMKYSTSSYPPYDSSSVLEECRYTSSLDLNFEAMKAAEKLETKSISSSELKCIRAIFTRYSESSDRAEGICNFILESEKSSQIALLSLTQMQTPDPNGGEYNIIEAEVERIKKQIGSAKESKMEIYDGRAAIYRDSKTEKYWHYIADVNKHSEAVTKCEALRNFFGNWRLPTVIELYTAYKDGISRYIRGGQTVKAWSKSSVADKAENVWIVNLETGTTEATSQSALSPRSVWCVRTNPDRD